MCAISGFPRASRLFMARTYLALVWWAVAAMSPGPGVGSDQIGIRRVLAFALLGGLLACPVGGSGG